MGLDTGPFRFNLEIYKSKDEDFERQMAKRRMIRNLIVAVPFVVAAILVSIMFFI